uniref:Ig-like domain-containing protein n=1 Tax=Sinocyclocheilus rhinocerous TaxID=307959 RepID=A0A673N525_9TELE
SNSASLSIEKLPLAAEGVYTCQALYDTLEGHILRPLFHGLSVTRLPFVITLTVPVTKPYIVMSDSSPVEGTSVTMRCGLENGTGPINYIWEQESRESQLTTVRISYVNISGSFPVGPDQPQIDVTPYSVTERGYSALERETVSLLCQASSNPPSQYVWFYNNSQVYAGPQYTINRILRMHTGHYACLAQNTYLNTRSRKTITLTVKDSSEIKKGQETLYCLCHNTSISPSCLECTSILDLLGY